ncbi:uncharacterized protein MYCFIDRAFT_182600 [Pseudocercospora fijiensis CIRAD86]|uniref:Uncharacterized protein n=1 Tax=Pseudocercospora fijiensis (strain CIRAD86) TaxID=383855 RepID=M3AZT6_PSEFD|nr:uncharacterized protein MYCFIDRAFT_182600 [Pseudocercospora fijiensis CIRAD86]EME82692.1 hypothetical protein MYCFIDRAFT_182600 [Pseudocercospora fijiensis CIRAD86]
MESPYIGRPSAEIDAAWEMAGSRDPIAITADKVMALGKDLSTAARWPESFNLGSEAYIAAPSAMHHIHCLDQIRRNLDFDHYFGARFPDGQKSKLHQLHTDHCLYIILKQLMCRPSMGTYVFDWVEGNLSPFPDFNVEEKCVDFDQFIAQHREVAIPRERMLKLRVPESQDYLKSSDEIKSALEIIS